MSDETDFSRWLAGELRTRRLSQSQLATYLGINSSSVNRWLRGGGTPSTLLIDRLARLWHLDPDYLLVIAGHKRPPSAMREESAEYAIWELDPRIVSIARDLAQDTERMKTWLALGETLVQLHMEDE